MFIILEHPFGYRCTTTAVADDMGSGPSAHAAYSCPLVLLGRIVDVSILFYDRLLLALQLGGSNRTHLIMGSPRPIDTWSLRAIYQKVSYKRYVLILESQRPACWN